MLHGSQQLMTESRLPPIRFSQAGKNVGQKVQVPNPLQPVILPIASVRDVVL